MCCRRAKVADYAAILPSSTNTGIYVCDAGVQKTPDRKVVGSPGVQGSPKKVSYIFLVVFCLYHCLKLSNKISVAEQKLCLPYLVSTPASSIPVPGILLVIKIVNIFAF